MSSFGNSKMAASKRLLRHLKTYQAITHDHVTFTYTVAYNNNTIINV